MLKFCETTQQQKNIFLWFFSAILTEMKSHSSACIVKTGDELTEADGSEKKKRSDLQYASYTFIEKKLLQCS